MKDKPTTKEEFLIQYVLARASTVDNYSAMLAVNDANAVWDKIQELTKWKST